MSISRRKFVQLGALASASLMVPQFLKGFQYTPAPLLSHSNKILIVVQLSGGNDGLNTVIPYRNDIYYKCRPQIGIRREAATALTDDVGINPALKTIKKLYDDGKVSIINGVGYPHPNRSHFRSMDIWQSGGTSQDLMDSGWLGRYLDASGDVPEAYNSLAIEIDDTLSLAVKGAEKTAMAVNDIGRYHRAAANSYFKNIAAHNAEHDAQLAGYLYKTLRETTTAADYIYEMSKKYTSTGTYPDSLIGKRMKTIGSLILSGAATRVYYVSHGSFDTHANQPDRQDKLLGQLDGALDALVSDLKANNRFDDVLIMTFSEFGRRVAQNASNGTDHGTAGNVFLISGGLAKSGIHNQIPDLSDLDDGDLKYSVDFKQIYATILDKWLLSDSRKILARKYDHLPFV